MKRHAAAAKILVVAILVLFPSIHALGQATTSPEQAFKSAEANRAVATDAATEAKARAEYEKVLVASKTRLIADLEVIKDRTLKAGDLDEAVKIRDKIAALKDELARLTAPARVVGQWNVVTGAGFHGTIQLNADGTALADHKLKGRWTIEQGNLVIRWEDGANISTYTSGNSDVMTGKSSINNEGLTATRVRG